MLESTKGGSSFVSDELCLRIIVKLVKQRKGSADIFIEQNRQDLADDKLKSVGKHLRFQFHAIKKLNKKITPKEIINARKQFRTSVIVRNIYSEVLNIIQATVMKKISNKKYKSNQKKYLNDFSIVELKQLYYLLTIDDDNLFKWYLNRECKIKIPKNITKKSLKA